MRVLLLAALFAVFAGSLAAPKRSSLQSGPEDADSKPFIEEVVVESILHVRGPTAGRTGRTNTLVNLQDGSRVTEKKS